MFHISKASQVIETNDVKTVKFRLQMADSNTVVFSDIDYTLICPTSKLFYPACPYRKEAIEIFRKSKDYSPNPQMRGIFHLKRKSMLVSKEWPKIVQSLLDRNIPVYTLSQSEADEVGPIKNMKQLRYHELEAHALLFKKDFQGREEEMILKGSQKQSTLPAVFYRGLFLTGSFKKSDVIKEYIRRAAPGCILFIDDRKDHVEDVQLACQEMGTCFLGIIYRGFDSLEGEPNPKAAFLQLKALLNDKPEWIEDEEAEQKALCYEQAYIRNEESKNLYLKEIMDAKQFVILGTFKLHKGLMPDSEILNAIKQAVINLTTIGSKIKRNPVRIFLESRLRPNEIRQYEDLLPDSSLKSFTKTGASVVKDVKLYDNLHFKILLTEQMAIIGTTNFDIERPGCVIRDFCIYTTNSDIRNEIKRVLEQAERGDTIQFSKYRASDLMPGETRLTWGPQQHRQHLVELIKLADSIDIYQQDLQDPIIFNVLRERLEIGNEKNLNLRILMSQYPFGEDKENESLIHLKELTKSGAQVRLTGRKKYENDLPLHVHAKVMLIGFKNKSVNNRAMYLGSSNFYGPVLDPEAKDLNAGIITRAPNYIDTVQRTFNEDWSFHEGEDLVTF